MVTVIHKQYNTNSYVHRLPEQYASLQLPHKLPPTKENLPMISLPMLGYMEQNVATALIKALTSCGNSKPKYPFLSASRSALFYIAYHLKGKHMMIYLNVLSTETLVYVRYLIHVVSISMTMFNFNKHNFLSNGKMHMDYIYMNTS